LAKAVLKDIGVTTFFTVEETEVVKGGGIVARVNGQRVAVGNVALMQQEDVELSEEARRDIERFERNGDSLVLTAINRELKILMRISYQIRTNVKQDLQRLKQLGV